MQNFTMSSVVKHSRGSGGSWMWEWGAIPLFLSILLKICLKRKKNCHGVVSVTEKIQNTYNFECDIMILLYMLLVKLWIFVKLSHFPEQLPVNYSPPL